MLTKLTHPTGTPSMEAVLPVAEIQRFCMHDGPGVRTVVFLKGCPLRCAWCHNPEMQRSGREILFSESLCIFCGACVSACPTGAHTLHPLRLFDRAKCVACGRCVGVCCTEALTEASREMTVGEILETVLKDQAFYGETGGITLSGGEPLLHTEGVIALLTACREAGLSTAVETCGALPPETLSAVAPLVDLFLWDVKDTCDERHKRYTGVSNGPILENLRLLDRLGGKTRLRCILVEGVNTEEAHYAALAALYGELTGCEGVELIPYHAYAGSKMLPLGLPDNGRPDWIPSSETMGVARDYLSSRGVPVRQNGA